MSRKPVPEGIRITKVGLWYVLLSVIVAIAATNTGNNALYMVLGVMFGALILSGVASRENVRGLGVELAGPDEVFANRPFAIGFTLRNTSRLFGRFLLLFSVAKTGQPLLVPFLPAKGRSQGQLEMLLARRGRHRFPAAHVASLFPFGLFRKGIRYPVEVEVLVYPEIFPAGPPLPESSSAPGQEVVRRAGSGHELFALRLFRPGDDPRGIHWKQTAKTGELVFMERHEERSRRLSILFDNAVGELGDEASRERFERLVSEAATAAVDHLGRGYEVELVTREGLIPFGAGPRQRLAVLEALALVEPRPKTAEPLASRDPRARQLKVHLEVVRR